jgi:hypothetical protein
MDCTNEIVHSQLRTNPSTQLIHRILTLLFVLVSIFGYAQQGNLEQCAAHLRHEKLLNTDPVYKRNHLNAEQQIQGLLQNITINGSNGAQAQIFGDTLEIPVVVHVIHTGQSVGVGANIATSQINDAITVLNDRYRKTPNTHGDANGVDTEIQFVLAKRDPDCNSTTGIVRVNGSSVTDYADEGITAGQGSGAVELDVKALSRWPATDYLNIWVVTEIEDNGGGFGIQGYAYFPGVSASYDGVVIMNTCFGTTGTVNSWNNLNRTLTHEVGHYFNLYHTFEGDNSGNNCPTATNGCGSGSGDCCADTEKHIRAASNCPTGTNACTSTSWDDVQHNYMNYSSQSCADMFTDDQSDRMRAALLGPRHSLLSSLGTEAPTTNTVASASCSPNTTNLSNTFGLGIGNVTFEDIDVTSDGAVGDGGYRDYSCHHMAEVDPSTSYSISIKTSSTNNEDARVYIDYNDDGDFLDAGESVFSNDTDTLHTGTITIPSSPTLTTPLRMRVITDWQGNTAAMNTAGSCYTPQYGQVEDYIVYVRGSMTASMSGTDVSCNGGSDGTITVTVSSGTANYAYSWSNGSSTNNSSSASNTVTGLAAGTYTVTVTDANSTTVSASHTIGEPSTSVSATITLNQEVACFGGNDGSLTASGSGGTGAFSFSWTTGATTATANGLTAGTYTVTVTDANGCTDTESYTMNQPTAALAISLNVDSNASCNGSATGVISSTASGGTTAYVYVWSTGSNVDSITGLTAGTYTVTLTDANGCTTSQSATVTQPTTINLSITVDSNASCGGSATGGLTASASGGVGTLSYAWNTSATTTSITGLTAGTYTVTVTDLNGCTETESQSITGGGSLSATVTVNSNVSCNGGNDGSLTPSSTGGTNPITYAWNNGSTSATITGLTAGTYTVTVTENGGCTSTATGTITEPTSLVASISVNSVSCNGGSDGSMTASASGGTTSYSYTWSNSASTATITNLTAGTYTVTVTDANGCTDTETANVTEPSALVVTITVDSNAGCGGSSLGGLTASTTGGTGSITYVWNTGATTASVSGLIAGTYSVTATDANGCTDSTNQTITSSGSAITTTDTLSICNGDSVLVHGNMVSQTGTYVDTLTSSGGCDSISTILVQNGLGSYGFYLVWIYQGDSIFLGGAFQSNANIYVDTFASANGCDSVVETFLWVYPVQFGTDSITICQNDSVLLGGIFRSTAGTYIDTTIIGGTAHINTTSLFINVPTQVNNSMSIVLGDSAYLAGAWRTGSGTYCDTIGNCDSLICTQLTVNVVTYLTISDTVELCEGDSAFAGGAYQYNTGVYLDTVGNNFGVDTIYTTEIIVDPNSIQLVSSGLYLKSNQSVGPFQWYDCGSQTVISTTATGYIMPGYSGNFAVINSSATCNDTSVCVFHANTSNKNGLDVRGYPTAVHEQYTIVFDAAQSEVGIDLFDIQGQLIQTWEEQEVERITLPMHHLAPGYYLVRLSTLDGQRSLKFAKLRD